MCLHFIFDIYINLPVIKCHLISKNSSRNTWRKSMSLENLAKMDQQWYYLNSNFLNNQLSRIISTILTMAPLTVLAICFWNLTSTSMWYELLISELMWQANCSHGWLYHSLLKMTSLSGIIFYFLFLFYIKRNMA